MAVRSAVRGVGAAFVHRRRRPPSSPPLQHNMRSKRRCCGSASWPRLLVATTRTVNIMLRRGGSNGRSPSFYYLTFLRCCFSCKMRRATTLLCHDGRWPWPRMRRHTSCCSADVLRRRRCGSSCPLLPEDGSTACSLWLRKMPRDFCVLLPSGLSLPPPRAAGTKWRSCSSFSSLPASSASPPSDRKEATNKSSSSLAAATPTSYALPNRRRPPPSTRRCGGARTILRALFVSGSSSRG